MGDASQGVGNDDESPSSLNEPARDPSPYDAIFFLTYFSNGFLMVAVSLLFRYSDFINLHGGAELELGLIVGVGTTGAIAFRIIQGVGIDRLGARFIWLGSLALYTLSIFLHLTIGSVHDPQVYLVRVLMQSGLAGTFGASLTFVSLRVPRHRATEVLGMHGTSGFLGMAIGPIVGDMLFESGNTVAQNVSSMFYAAGLAALLSLACAFAATRGKIHKRPSRRAPALALLRRYNPGVLLLVAAVMGMGLSLPGVFVRPFAASLDIDQIRWFFIVYNIIAFSVRVMSRRLPEAIGERKVILLGVGFLAMSMPTYLLVHEPWQLIFPAMATGLGHAFLFPAVVATAGFHFPPRYRGLATTLILGMFDVGILLGQPLLGGIVTLARNNNWPAYPTMFLFAGSLVGSIGLLYLLTAKKQTKRFR